MPLWNPYFYCGQPLFAALQPGILYPFNILLLILPFDFAFNIIIIIHFFLAGCFTYLFIKTINGSDTAGFIGAIIFMLSGYLLSVHNLLPHLLSVAWLPLVLLYYHKYIRDSQFKHLIFIAFFLLLMFLGGAVEILYGTFILLFILLFFPNPFGLCFNVISFKKRIFSFGLIVFLFLFLSSFQLLPFLELAFKSVRDQGLSYNEAITWSMKSKDLIQFFIPDLYGYGYSTQKYWQNQSWLKTIYLGIIPFILIIFFFLEKKKKALPLILIMVISILLSFGGNTSIYYFLFNYLPFLNTIRYPVKFLFIFIFFLSIIAGIGYDSFCQKTIIRDKSTEITIKCILVFSILTVSLWSIINFYETPIKTFLELKGFIPPNYNFLHINLHNIKRFFLFCSILGPIILFGWRYPKKKTVFSIILISLLTIDLFFANKGYYQKYNSKSYHKLSQSMNFLKKDKSLFRVVTAPRTLKEKMNRSEVFSDPIQVDKERIAPGFNLEHSIFCISGSEVIRLKDYEKVLSLIMSSPKPDSTNLLSLLNVKYIISKHEYASEELEHVETIGNRNDPNALLNIYKNHYCLPRAFLVDKYQVLQSEREYKNILQSKEFNPIDLVLLDKRPFIFQEKKQTETSFGKIEENLLKKEVVIINDYNLNKIELSAFVEDYKILFLSETYYPGWKVYINGKKSKIYRANFAFRAIPLTPGYHTIKFIYRPLSVILGLCITILTIIFISFYYISKKIKHIKK